MDLISSTPGNRISAPVIQGPLLDPHVHLHAAVTAKDAHADAPAKDASLTRRLQDASMKASGYAYLIGDAALFGAGIASREYKDALTGLAFTAGGLSCARYGNPSQDLQLKMVTQHLGDYLRRKDIAIPDGNDTASLRHLPTVVNHIEDYLYAHPEQALSFGGIVGGALQMKTGLQHKENKSGQLQRNPMQFASGALVASGAIADLVIPEKKTDPKEHDQHGKLRKAVDWVEEKPLRLSGGLYALNNVAFAAGAFHQRNDINTGNAHLYKYLTAACYLFANGMLGLSSKEKDGKHGLDTAHLASLATASAQVIARQPEPIRDALIEQTACYLSHQPEISLTTAEIGALLHEKLKTLGKDSWQAKVASAAPGHEGPGRA